MGKSKKLNLDRLIDIAPRFKNGTRFDCLNQQYRNFTIVKIIHREDLDESENRLLTSNNETSLYIYHVNCHEKNYFGNPSKVTENFLISILDQFKITEKEPIKPDNKWFKQFIPKEKLNNRKVRNTGR